MYRLGKFLHLPLRDKALFLKATMLLAGIRLGVSILPFATVRSVLTRLALVGIGRTQQSADAAQMVEGAVWAVETAGRHFPAIGTCLYQALAAHVILARRGCRSNLRIGVRRGADGQFAGHAWLEKDGKVLIGGEHRGTYIPMPSLNGLDPHTASGTESDPAFRWPVDHVSTRHDAKPITTRLD
jgi:transglutaminase superfamily protein